jgi:hypothetical protein
MNKKLITIALLLSPLTSYAKPHYIGLEYQSNNLSYKAPNNSVVSVEPDDYYESNLSDLAFLAGYKINNQLSIEASYLDSKEGKTNDNTGLVYSTGALTGQSVIITTEVKLKSYSLNIHPTYYIKGTNFSLFGILGISYLKFKFNESFNDGTSNISTEDSFNPNIGFGVDYKMNNQYSVLMKMKYTPIDNIKPINLDGVNEVSNLTNISVGIIYRF